MGRSLMNKKPKKSKSISLYLPSKHFTSARTTFLIQLPNYTSRLKFGKRSRKELNMVICHVRVEFGLSSSGRTLLPIYIRTV